MKDCHEHLLDEHEFELNTNVEELQDKIQKCAVSIVNGHAQHAITMLFIFISLISQRAISVKIKIVFPVLEISTYQKFVLWICLLNKVTIQYNL